MLRRQPMSTRTDTLFPYPTLLRSSAGITGAAAPDTNAVGNAVDRIKRHTRLPVAVGFGIRDGARAAEIASVADAAVVGSALVERVAEAQAKGIDPAGHVLALVREQIGRAHV